MKLDDVEIFDAKWQLDFARRGILEFMTVGLSLPLIAAFCLWAISIISVTSGKVIMALNGMVALYAWVAYPLRYSYKYLIEYRAAKRHLSRQERQL